MSAKRNYNFGERSYQKTPLAATPPKHLLSFSCEKDLRDIFFLAGFLFLSNEYDLCYDVCSLLDSLQFQGNHTHWSYIKSCRLLKCRIEMIQGNTSDAKRTVDVLLQLENPQLHMRVWHAERRLYYSRRDEYALCMNNPKQKSVLRYIRKDLVSVYLICNNLLLFNTLPDEEHEIMACCNKIKELIAL